MPELPEVETVVRQLRRLLPGRCLGQANVYWARTIAGMEPEEFIASVHGHTVESVDRRAKFIVIKLKGNLWLVVHLRMSGRLLVAPADSTASPYTRVAIELDDGSRLLFNDTRKFGRIWLVDQAGLEQMFSRLGPEPLPADFTVAHFAEMLQNKKRNLKSLLLDQSFLAGLGNIYVDEALWLAQLHPLRTAASLSNVEVGRLFAAIRSVLNQGIEHHGTTFAMFVDPSGEPGQNQESLKVYGRAKKSKNKPAHPCLRCGTPIEKILVAQRGTHFCPTCQIL